MAFELEQEIMGKRQECKGCVVKDVLREGSVGNLEQIFLESLISLHSTNVYGLANGY